MLNLNSKRNYTNYNSLIFFVYFFIAVLVVNVNHYKNMYFHHQIVIFVSFSIVCLEKVFFVCFYQDKHNYYIDNGLENEYAT